jgi:hypothetical protein
MVRIVGWMRRGDIAADGAGGRRVRWLKRSCDLIVAQCKSMAAGRLAELTECKNPETARKACLDIIQFAPIADADSEDCNGKCSCKDRRYENLSDETASKLLAVLAEDGVE